MNKQSIKSFFKKIANAALYAGSALLVPLSISLPDKKKGKPLNIKLPWGKAAIFGMAYWVIQPLSLFLFPRAEEVMKKEGVDPEILKEITTTKDIRIIPDNLAGKTYYIFNHSPWLEPVTYYKTFRDVFLGRILDDNTAAFHDPSSPGLLAKWISPDVKKIYMKDSREEYAYGNSLAEKLVDHYSKGKLAHAPLLTPQERHLLTFLHELRHSSPEQQNFDEITAEGDSDYYAAKYLAKALGRPDLQQKALVAEIDFYTDARKHNHDQLIHDTFLYQYLKSANQPIPDGKTLIQANKDAAPAIQSLKDAWSGKKGAEEKYKKEIQKISPLAAKKAELYKKAFNVQFIVIDDTAENEPSAPLILPVKERSKPLQPCR